MSARIGNGAAIVATRGSSTFTTCSTAATEDAAPRDPTIGLKALPGDKLIIALPSAWRFLRWEGSDHAAVGEGANVWLPTDTPERPQLIDVPVPIRLGDSIVNLSLWMVSTDGRVIGQLEIAVRVTVS